MEKTTIFIVLLFLLSVFVYGEETATPVLTESVPTSTIQTANSVPAIASSARTKMEQSCVDESLNQKMNELTMMLKKADMNNEQDKMAEIKTQIEALAKERQLKKENCMTKIAPATLPQITKADACNDKEYYKRKIEYYKAVSADPPKMKATGITKEEVEKIITELETVKEELNSSCGGSKRTNLGQLVSGAVKSEDGSAKDIVEYYKSKIYGVSSSADSTEAQIRGLRALRNEIAVMVSELIKKQNEIKADDVKTIVDKIEVKANEIKADNVKIDVEGEKSIETKIKDKAIKVIVDKEKVKLNQEGISVETKGVSIENNTLKFNNTEIRATPKEVKQKVEEKEKKESKAIQLVENKNKIMYKITTEENRKLFAVINVKADKITNVDAITGEIASEESPWWAFLSTKT